MIGTQTGACRLAGDEQVVAPDEKPMIAIARLENATNV